MYESATCVPGTSKLYFSRVRGRGSELRSQNSVCRPPSLSVVVSIICMFIGVYSTKTSAAWSNRGRMVLDSARSVTLDQLLNDSTCPVGTAHDRFVASLSPFVEQVRHKGLVELILDLRTK